MSWLYLPEQAEDYLPPNTCLDGKQCATSSEKRIPSQCSKPESKTGSSTTHQSGATFGRSGTTTLSAGDSLTIWLNSIISSSQQGSRASHLQQGGNNEAQVTPVTAGPTQFASLAKSSQRGFSWRTLQTCFTPGKMEHLPTSSKSLESWPHWGTWDGGAAYRHTTQEPITNGNGCGLLPTPVKRDGQSFYVVTLKTAYRIFGKKPLKQLHWGQYGIVLHDLKKAWANPQFSEHLMGWPIRWTALEPLAKDKFQSWLKRRGRFCQDD